MRKFVVALALALIFAVEARAQQNSTSPPQSISTQQLVLVTQNPIAAPTPVTIEPNIAGSTTYYYWIVTHSGSETSAPAGPYLISNAPATLGGLYSNSITWTQAVAGATYDLLRTTSTAVPSGACGCAVGTAIANSSFTDGLASTTAYTVSTSPDQASQICSNITPCGSYGIQNASATKTIAAAIAALPAAGGDVWVNGTVASWAGGTIPPNVRLHFAPGMNVSLTGQVALSRADAIDCAFGQNTDLAPYGGATVFNVTSGVTSTQDVFLDSSANGFRMNGCWISTGGNGRDAIHVAGSSSVRLEDLTILDPGRDGLRVDNTGQQSYDDTFTNIEVHHAAGDGYSFRTDAGTADLDRITCIDCRYWSFDPGGSAYSGTNGFHFFIPSGAAASQTIADVVLLNGISHLGGSGNPGEVYLDDESTSTSLDYFKNFEISRFEAEADAGSSTCTALKISDAAAINIIALAAHLLTSCSTDTNISSSNAMVWNFTGGNGNEPNLFDQVQLGSGCGGDTLTLLGPGDTQQGGCGIGGTPVLRGGTCTMSAGTSCTSTITYGSHCVTSDTGGTIAGQCAISGTTLTVTAATSNSSTWAWVIVN